MKRCLMGVLSLCALAAPGRAEETAAAAPVAVIAIQGGVFLGTDEYVVQAIKRVEREDFSALVIEMDTPGGALDVTQEIVKAMLAAKKPVLVFVSPRGAQAASAGTFITMAAHIAAMAPGTRIGAAHPVFLSFMPGTPGGGDEKDEKKKQQEEIMNEKVTNDTVSFILGIARERGRNAEWAEKSVRESVSITADEAVANKVVDLVAENVDDLLARVDGRQVQLDRQTTTTLHTRGARQERWEKSLKQRLLGALANPNLLYILFLLGLGGLAMEFYHPGLIFPGVLGALCLLLAFISANILPVSLGGFLLVLAGLGLLVAEAFVTSYGLLAAGGAVLLVLGGILLIDPAAQPYYVDPSMSVDWSVLIPAALIIAALVLYLGYKVVSTQRRRIVTGEEGMVGLAGQARTEIGPRGGSVFVHGEIWKAISEETIPAGSAVEVVKVEGLQLLVRPRKQP
jgi:membrane-bound serine protease (ClpP class)